MSDAASQGLKVSREGIVLIKSFEGFRPRAIRREEGGWVIGYGHTLSAREGATVSEADAELLLRYDLLPVEKSLNETVPTRLNQHQFDALASFAFSVGLDRFASSDVRQRLTAGATAEAADAMMGWPEPALPDTALRRRAAERALFSADPAAPVALADLLAAPLPPPPVVPAQAELGTPEPVIEAEPETPDEPFAETGTTDPRGAAVAALLGEAEAPAPVGPPVQSEPVAEPTAFVVPVIDAWQPAAVDSVAAEAQAQPLPDPTPDASPSEALRAPVEAAEAPEETVAETEADEAADVAAREDGVEPVEAVDEPIEPGPTPANDTPTDLDQHAMAVARYSPYGVGMMGPLPYLRPAGPRVVQPDPEPEIASDVEPVGRPLIETETAPVDMAEAVAPIVEKPAEEPPAPVEVEAAFEPIIAETAAADTITAPMSYQEPAFASDAAPVLHVAAAPLVLTPSDDAPEPAVSRALWTPEQRAEPAAAEGGLFGEDLSLTQSVGPVLGQEFEVEPPVRFDWSETGAFIIMGAVGLTAFGASMAAFRLASEQSNGGSETTMIAWVLAVIGAACVGVSSFNLYRRWGLPGGD